MPNDDNKENQNNNNRFLNFGIGFGLMAGALFASIVGIFIKSPLIRVFVWALSPGLGMLSGIVTGSLMDQNRNKG